MNARRRLHRGSLLPRNGKKGERDILASWGVHGELKVPLPSIHFQQQFVSLVENIDSEISLFVQQLATLKTQKKGLMRKLLTGEIRVPVREGGD
jgi:hypothetical protein